jgi:hypothetical protein
MQPGPGVAGERARRERPLRQPQTLRAPTARRRRGAHRPNTARRQGTCWAGHGGEAGRGRRPVVCGWGFRNARARLCEACAGGVAHPEGASGRDQSVGAASPQTCRPQPCRGGRGEPPEAGQPSAAVVGAPAPTGTGRCDRNLRGPSIILRPCHTVYARESRFSQCTRSVGGSSGLLATHTAIEREERLIAGRWMPRRCCRRIICCDLAPRSRGVVDASGPTPPE